MYLQILESDSRLLAAAAARDLDAQVPHCPGWAVRDVVEHISEVYEHKIATIAMCGGKPDPWPPEWPADRDPLDWFSDVRGRLLETLGKTDSNAPSWTWSPSDQTVGFWVRRMSQETAVHRADVEEATGRAAPVNAELAVDGVDEVLTVMLAGDWSDYSQPDLTGTVDVETGDRVWRVTMKADDVTVTAADEGTPPDATVVADPSPLLLWMWGRADSSAVDIRGDATASDRLRRRLALTT